EQKREKKEQQAVETDVCMVVHNKTEHGEKGKRKTRRRTQPFSNRRERHASGRQRRITVNAGRDATKSNAVQLVLKAEVQACAIWCQCEHENAVRQRE